ncbi:MAG: hypothetical protein ABIS50_10530 [Luteolibacter sp.]|uniref:hypothetical protein n=1 Tax=Luteolibacter sp. TaxID=1962973 RepID=UPI0032654902
MKLKPVTALAALFLIGAGGFMAGRVSSSNSAAVEHGPGETKSSRTSSSSLSLETGVGTKKSSQTRAESKHQESSKDRLARLESIVRGENPLDRNRALLAYIDQLGPGDFEEAVASFRELGITDSRMGEYSLLLTAWAQADPTSALAYAKENTRNGFAQDTILTTWATTDPDAAIRWAQANFEGDGPNPYLPGIIRGLSGTDPTKATELLASMPRSEERGKGLDFMLPHLLQQGTAATQAWITGISDEALRNGAMMRVADKLAENDPAGTAAWLIANPGEASQRRMDDVYGVWASKDSQAALSSFSSLPAGDDRSNALRGVVSSVAAENPKTAVSLLDRFPNDVNDRVVQDVVWHSFGSDPALAATQIARITDQGQRDQMYQRTLSAWMDRDPTSAQAWISTNPIPESVQTRLIRRQAERQASGQ